MVMRSYKEDAAAEHLERWIKGTLGLQPLLDLSSFLVIVFIFNIVIQIIIYLVPRVVVILIFVHLKDLCSGNCTLSVEANQIPGMLIIFSAPACPSNLGLFLPKAMPI